MTSPPLLTTPAKVTLLDIVIVRVEPPRSVVPLMVSDAPPGAPPSAALPPKTTLLALVFPAPLELAKVPPLIVTVPVPRALLLAMASNPLLITVPPA
jgi:hypothetical protein